MPVVPGERHDPVLLVWQVVRMLVVVLVSFLCLWAPYFTYYILWVYRGRRGSGITNAHLAYSVSAVSYVSCCINPVLYTATSRSVVYTTTSRSVVYTATSRSVVYTAPKVCSLYNNLQVYGLHSNLQVCSMHRIPQVCSLHSHLHVHTTPPFLYFISDLYSTQPPSELYFIKQLPDPYFTQYYPYLNSTMKILKFKSEIINRFIKLFSVCHDNIGYFHQFCISPSYMSHIFPYFFIFCFNGVQCIYFSISLFCLHIHRSHQFHW